MLSQLSCMKHSFERFSFRILDTVRLSWCLSRLKQMVKEQFHGNFPTVIRDSVCISLTRHNITPQVDTVSLSDVRLITPWIKPLTTKTDLHYINIWFVLDREQSELQFKTSNRLSLHTEIMGDYFKKTELVRTKYKVFGVKLLANSSA